MTRFQRTPAVYSKKTNGVWIILERNQSYIRELNDVAGEIWELLDTPQSESSIVEKISKTYNARRYVVETDTRNFLTSLERDGLVTRIETP